MDPHTPSVKFQTSKQQMACWALGDIPRISCEVEAGLSGVGVVAEHQKTPRHLQKKYILSSFLDITRKGITVSFHLVNQKDKLSNKLKIAVFRLLNGCGCQLIAFLDEYGEVVSACNLFRESLSSSARLSFLTSFYDFHLRLGSDLDFPLSS